MKKLLVVVLTLCIASFAVAENINKADLQSAIDAYQSGLEVTKAQHKLLEQYYFDMPVIDHAGGPDAFGYVFQDSDEVDGPVYNWIDITATGTEVSDIDGIGDDSYIGPYALGFDFPFYGTNRTEVYLHSNGVISFEDWGDDASYGNEALPGGTSDLEGASVCFFWDDLDPQLQTDYDGGQIYYEAITLNDMPAFVVTYDNVMRFPGSATQVTFTAQTILFEDGTILFQYNNFDDGFEVNTGAETIGIVNDDLSIWLEASLFDSPLDYPFAGLAIEFSTNVTADAELTGTVTDFDTGNPIDGAIVTAGGLTGTTGVDGVYTITGLFPVTTIVTATADGYFDFGPESIDLVSGTNTFDFVMAMAPTQTFFTDFEAGPEPFATDGLVWEFGTPTIEPDGAFSGVNAWATILAGDYDNSQDEYLVSDPIIVDSPAAFMTYMHWYNYESGWDGYNVNASIDGGATWTLLIPEGGYPDDTVSGLDGGPGFTGPVNTWEEVTVQIGAYMGQEILIAFRHGTDSSVNSYSGVTIDDFALYGTGGGVEPDPVTLTLTPITTVIPPAGGDVIYDAQLVSTIPASMAGLRYQTFVTLPNSTVYGPLANIPFNLTPFMDITVTGQTQAIPGNAPAGMYTFTAIAGVPNNPALQVTDSFGFEKTGVATDGVDNWDASEFSFLAGEEATTVSMPTAFAMNEAYPNPFNPSTSVMISLPEASDLTVSVFNVMGQQVAQLANGKYTAGQHNFSFEASNLASGLYFIQAQVPGQLNAIQKVTLMK